MIKIVRDVRGQKLDKNESKAQQAQKSNSYRETMWMFNTGYSLGWGVGAAMGAKLGEPDRQVALSIGGGSVMNSASGFWTQARYGISVLNIVWNNKNYQTVRRRKSYIPRKYRIRLKKRNSKNKGW